MIAELHVTVNNNVRLKPVIIPNDFCAMFTSMAKMIEDFVYHIYTCMA